MPLKGLCSLCTEFTNNFRKNQEPFRIAPYTSACVKKDAFILCDLRLDFQKMVPQIFCLLHYIYFFIWGCVPSQLKTRTAPRAPHTTLDTTIKKHRSIYSMRGFWLGASHKYAFCDVIGTYYIYVPIAYRLVLSAPAPQSARRVSD